LELVCGLRPDHLVARRGYLPGEYPGLPTWALWFLGALTALLFFGSVLVHELAHAWVALRNGIPVREITLHIFGGVAYLEREPRTAGAEFRIAIAGPLSSLALAGLFGLLFLADRGISALAAPSLWLARINLMLALFNLIPGFPLDGGRVLRALIWRVSGNAERATAVAAYSGQAVAFGFMAFGVYTVLTGGLINGLWLVFIGWFLQNAAVAHRAQATIERTLGGVTVARVMTRGYPRVADTTTLDRLVTDQVLGGGQRFFIITDAADRPRGFVSLTDIMRVPRDTWGRTTAADAMTPWGRVVRVAPNADIIAALRTLEEARVTQLPVVATGEREDRPLGTLSRDDVMRYLRLRREVAA
jgi:Zn-dependent protease/CBS domain-containing protein